MLTIVVLMTGLTLLALCVAAGRFLGKPSSYRRGALLFLPLWFIGAAFNLWMGISEGGSSVAGELLMFVLTFGIPAAIAGLIASKSS